MVALTGPQPKPSIESLEEMLKKQMPQQAPRSNYVEREVVSTPDAPIASEAEMQAHFQKAAQNKSFNPAPPVIKTQEERLMDVPLSTSERTITQPQAAQPQAPSDQTSAFLESLKQLSSANTESGAPAATGEYAEIRKQMEEFKGSRDAGGGIHWAELLGMAIPTVVGASVGQLGAGAIPAGQYGMKRAEEERKKEQDFNKMLTELQGKLALAQGKQASKNPSDPIKTFQGPDGKPYLLKFSQGQALGLPEYKEGSFQPLETAGGLVAFDKKQGKAGEVFAGAPQDKASANEAGKDRRQKEAQQFQALTKVLAPNSPVVASTENLSRMVNIMSQLNAGGPIGSSVLPSLIARSVAGEKGVLTDKDVSRVSGDPALIAQYNRLWQKMLAGESLSDFDRKDVETVVRIAFNVEADRLKREAKAFKDSFAATGVDIGSAVDAYVTAKEVELPKLAPRVPSARQQAQSERAQGVMVGPMKNRDGSFVLDQATGQPKQFKYKKIMKPDGSRAFEVIP